MYAVGTRRAPERPTVLSIVVAAGSLVGAIFIARSGIGNVAKGFALAATLALPVGVTIYSGACVAQAAQRAIKQIN